MGINAIVMTENPHRLSIASFGALLEADPWGRRAAHRFDGRIMWESFDWKGRPYLSWLTGPRWRWLGLGSREDAQGEDRPEDWLRPDPDNPVQITFLKVMLAVERITGGAVYLGLDVVGFRSPEDAAEIGEAFRLPPRLDDWLEDWRSVAALEPKAPELVF